MTLPSENDAPASHLDEVTSSTGTLLILNSNSVTLASTTNSDVSRANSDDIMSTTLSKNTALTSPSDETTLRLTSNGATVSSPSNDATVRVRADEDKVALSWIFSLMDAVPASFPDGTAPTLRADDVSLPSHGDDVTLPLQGDDVTLPLHKYDVILESPYDDATLTLPKDEVTSTSSADDTTLSLSGKNTTQKYDNPPLAPNKTMEDSWHMPTMAQDQVSHNIRPPAPERPYTSLRAYTAHSDSGGNVHANVLFGISDVNS